MASGIYLNESVWNSPLVGYNKKQNRRVVDLHLEKTRPDRAIRSSVAITILPLGHGIWKKINNKKEKCDFLKIIFLCIF